LVAWLVSRAGADAFASFLRLIYMTARRCCISRFFLCVSDSHSLSVHEVRNCVSKILQIYHYARYQLI